MVMFLVVSISAMAEEGTNAPGPMVLDLAGAKRVALRDNPDLGAARARVEAARARVGLATAAYYPRFSAFGSVGRLERAARDAGESASARTEGVRGLPATTESDGEGVTTDPYEVGLGASWMLFDGLAREFGHAGAKQRYLAEAQTEADVRRLVSQSVATAFYLAMRANAGIAIARQQESVNQALLTDTENRTRAGTAMEADVLNFRQRLNRARVDVLQAEQRQRSGQRVLRELLALPDATVFTLTYPETDPKLEPETVDGVRQLDVAMRTRPDLQALAQFVKAAKADFQAARGGHWPVLQADAELNYVGDGEFVVDEEHRDTRAALVLNWDWFQGGGVLADVRQRRALYAAAEEQFSADRLEVEREIFEEVDALEVVGAVLPVNYETLDLARRAQHMTRLRYEAGIESITRMNQVLNDEVSALVEVADSRLALFLGLETLAAATGVNAPAAE